MESKKIYFGDDEDYIKSLESQIKDLNEELEKNTCSSCKDNLELKKRLDVEIETSKWELRKRKITKMAWI